jgi:hypothetical protein
VTHKLTPSSSAPDTLRFTPEELEKDRGQVMSHAVNDIAIPSLRILLTSVLNTVDIAIPNKDQNKAVKRTIRDDFDTAYFGILGRAFPDCTFGQTTGSYAISPAPTKEESSTIK